MINYSQRNASRWYILQITFTKKLFKIESKILKSIRISRVLLIFGVARALTLFADYILPDPAYGATLEDHYMSNVESFLNYDKESAKYFMEDNPAMAIYMITLVKLTANNFNQLISD